MSDLQAFAAHCRAMSTAEHKPECKAKIPVIEPGWAVTERTVRPDPLCFGCVTDADRDLWTRLADEADAFLAREPEPDLFGASA